MFPMLCLYVGFVHFKNRKVSVPNATNFKVAVIGSGFSGLNTAIELKRIGIPFVLFEKGSRVGGTWCENTYPGCECDVASHVYSFSFEPNPVSILLLHIFLFLTD